jgi:Arc/MetJ family transcription regulator
MRTNIDIDDHLMAQAQQATGATTKKATVEHALRTVVRLAEQARIKELRGTLRWEGDLEGMRTDRP